MCIAPFFILSYELFECPKYKVDNISKYGCLITVRYHFKIAIFVNFRFFMPNDYAITVMTQHFFMRVASNVKNIHILILLKFQPLIT